MHPLSHLLYTVQQKQNTKHQKMPRSCHQPSPLPPFTFLLVTLLPSVEAINKMGTPHLQVHLYPTSTQQWMPADNKWHNS